MGVHYFFDEARQLFLQFFNAEDIFLKSILRSDSDEVTLS